MDEDGRAAIRNQLIGFVFQSFQLLPGLTALENVMLPLELSGDKNAKAAATALLDRVGLSHRLSHTPQKLVRRRATARGLGQSLCDPTCDFVCR